MAEQEKRLVPAGMSQETPAHAPPPKKKEPKQEPMSVGGFFENLAENAKDIAVGVTDAMTISARSMVEIIKQAEWLPELAKHPEWLGQELWNTTKQVGKAVVDPYQKHGLRVLYEEPLTALGDAATVLSGGGAALAKAGKVSKLGKLEAAGKAMAAAPGQVAQKLTELPLRTIGINPASRKALLTLEREERTIGELTKKKLNEVLDAKFKDFTDQDKALLDRLAVEGGSAAELAANPKVAQALEAYRGIVKEIREAQLGEKGRKLLTTEQFEAAVAKKYANRKGVDLETARQAIEGMEVKPIYTPAIGEGKKVGIMDLIWGPDEIITGKVGFLEPFKGGRFGQDPVAYMKKAVNDFVDTETRLRFMDRVIQDPKLVRPIRKGESALGQVVPEGIYKRYFDDRARAQATAVRDLKLKHGIEEAERMLTADPVTQKYVKSVASIGAMDPTVANYLKFTFTKASGRLGAFLRVYDKVLNAFKMSATTLNPRFYTGNIVGDGILSVMAGEYGLHWKTAKRVVDSLPPELRVGGRTVIEENAWMEKFQRVADIAQAADDLARAGIWTKEVAARFKQAGASFGVVEQTMDDFIRTVGNSVEELSNIQMKAQLLDEDIARGTPALLKLNTQIDRLQKKATKVVNLRYEAQRTGAQKARVDKLSDDYRTVNNALLELQERRDAAVAALREQMKSSGQYAQRIPEIQKYAEVARQATDRSMYFLGDYFGLGPVERAVFRRVVPFYSFTKAMTKLAFTYPLVAPKSAFFWHRYTQALVDMIGDPGMPESMAGYFPVGGYENGDTFWVRLTGLSPMAGVRLGRFGDQPVPSIVQFWNQNPAIRLIFRAAGAPDEFSISRPPTGKVWVEAGSGRINRFRPDGKIETVIPQMGPLEGLATLFPVVQIVHQLVASFDVRKGDERDRKGEYKFPVTTTQKIPELLGVKTKIADPRDIKRAEKMRVIGIFKDLERQYPRMSPEQKEYVRGLFADYRKGYYRTFKVAK